MVPMATRHGACSRTSTTCSILACGTSYYSGCTAKYWLEVIAGIPCSVEVASEYRYRTSVPNPRTLVVTISQSGETADTLAALRHAQSLGMTQHADHLQRGHQRHGARVQAGLHHPRRGGNWRGHRPRPSPRSWPGLFLLTLALAKPKAT